MWIVRLALRRPYTFVVAALQRLSLATSNALSFNTGSEFYAHLQPIFSALG
jgi:hypothetical protein